MACLIEVMVVAFTLWYEICRWI